MDTNENELDKIDPELKEFIVNEQIKSQIRAQIRKLNNICFEKCIEKPGNLQDDQTFHLIRLPRATVERANNASTNSLKVGSVFVAEDNTLEFIDDESRKLYKLIRNKPVKSENVRRANNVAACEESDLFKISVQKEEAVHLGKVTPSTLLAVPKVDEKDVSIVFA